MYYTFIALWVFWIFPAILLLLVCDRFFEWHHRTYVEKGYPNPFLRLFPFFGLLLGFWVTWLIVPYSARPALLFVGGVVWVFPAIYLAKKLMHYFNHKKVS